MTSNITVASTRFIGQCSDCRLVELLGGARRRPLPGSFPKPVYLRYQNVHAIIGFAGIGRVHGTLTTDWLARILGRAPARYADFGAILETIRGEAGSWLTPVGGRFFGHTFVVGAFQGMQAELAMISNWEHLSEVQEPAPQAQFWIEREQVTDQPRIVVIGQPSAVHANDRRLLARVMGLEPPGRAVLRALTEVNERVSSRVSRYVSPESVAFGLSPRGESMMKVHGPPMSDYQPVILTWGRNTSKLLDQLIAEKVASGEWEGPVRPVQGAGGTFTASRQDGAEPSSANDVGERDF